MKLAYARPIWMLSLFAALATGCAVPGDPGHVDEPPPVEHVDPPVDHVDPEIVLEPASADFLFLVDRSSSWSTRVDRWQGLVDAVSSFVGEHEGTRQIAATAFPRSGGASGTCESADYVSPDRAWSTSPDSVTHFLDELSFGGGSTLGPALEGTVRGALGHAAAEPQRSTSIVLLTDATPGDDETCDSSAWDTVADIAGRAFHHGRGPAVHVHVISVVGTAISPDHFARIDSIVDAGNGYAAVVNGSRADVARSAGFALEDIHDRMTTCTFAVPPGVRPEELTIRSPDGSSATAHRVNTASACAGDAFYLDDPESPRTATLCSGPSGRGGFCEMTYVRAGAAGAPKVIVSAQAD